MSAERDARGMGTVVLVRKGQTTWNRQGRVQGWAPSSLTDLGHEQAATMAEAVDRRYEVDRVVSSDLRRATATAQYLADRCGVALEEERAWRERDFGALQGIEIADLHDEFSRFSLAASGRDAVSERPESGESADDMQERVLGAWDDLTDDVDDGATVVVVCHAGPIHVVTSHVRGIDLAPVMGQQENCALNEVEVDGDEQTLLRQNETRHR
jgi:probable phosphoglycerate mutase